MFTSRAEHRLLLREDNADARLTPRGRELGLVCDERWALFDAKQGGDPHRRARTRVAFRPGEIAPDWARARAGRGCAGSRPERF